MRVVTLLGVFVLLCTHAAAQSPSTWENHSLSPTFSQNPPRSILIMPPVNNSMDLRAAATFLATATRPLAESGYYVIPVTLSTEMFRQNGITVAEEAHAIELDRLQEIFGADAALYITITNFGPRYRITYSVVEAAASAKLIDLRSGQELWSGRVWESEGSNRSLENSYLGRVLMLAVMDQIANTFSDTWYDVGRRAAHSLLSAGKGRNSIPFGPYHLNYYMDNK